MKRLLIAVIVWPCMMTAAAAQTADAQTYYNLSDDPNSLRLLGLDTIAGSGRQTSVVVVDVYRRPERFGLIQTWRIDCVRGRMGIVKAMQFEPGVSGKEQRVQGEEVRANSTPTSRLMSALVCTGAGQLQQRRVYRGALNDIIKTFWQR